MKLLFWAQVGQHMILGGLFTIAMTLLFIAALIFLFMSGMKPIVSLAVMCKAGTDVAIGYQSMQHFRLQTAQELLPTAETETAYGRLAPSSMTSSAWAITASRNGGARRGRHRRYEIRRGHWVSSAPVCGAGPGGAGDRAPGLPGYPLFRAGHAVGAASPCGGSLREEEKPAAGGTDGAGAAASGDSAAEVLSALAQCVPVRQGFCLPAEEGPPSSWERSQILLTGFQERLWLAADGGTPWGRPGGNESVLAERAAGAAGAADGKYPGTGIFRTLLFSMRRRDDGTQVAGGFLQSR